MQQNTPDLQELEAKIDHEERSRFTDESLESQLKRLLDAYYEEIQHRKPDDDRPYRRG